MSTLKTSNIQDTSGNNNSTPEQINQGRAKAWINFDGAAATIGTGRDSFNMDAVTDHGTGDYTVNFTNDMASANYVLLGTTDNYEGTNADSKGVVALYSNASLTASSARINTVRLRFDQQPPQLKDFRNIMIAVFGD